ncbi:MAG: ATP-binding protein [Chloroflexales bacterium]
MSDLTAETCRVCCTCGAPQGTVAVAWRGGTHYLWSPCSCREVTITASEARDVERESCLAHATVEGSAVDDLDALARQGMTLARFQRELLKSGPTKDHPFDIALGWIKAVQATGPLAIHTDKTNPPAMLYLNSPTRGCGKTHLAAGLALMARESGLRAALVEEKRLLAAYWGASLDAQERLLIRYAERMLFLVIDDLGRRPVRRYADEETTSVADVWDAILNRRYALGGWTVITSNHSPGELLDRGTINYSTFSRIIQMTRRRAVRVWGEDQRLTM